MADFMPACVELPGKDGKWIKLRSALTVRTYFLQRGNTIDAASKAKHSTQYKDDYYISCAWYAKYCNEKYYKHKDVLSTTYCAHKLPPNANDQQQLFDDLNKLDIINGIKNPLYQRDALAAFIRQRYPTCIIIDELAPRLMFRARLFTNDEYKQQKRLQISQMSSMCCVVCMCCRCIDVKECSQCHLPCSGACTNCGFPCTTCQKKCKTTADFYKTFT